MNFGEVRWAQKDGGPPITRIAGSPPGESGVSVLRTLFQCGAHFSATTRQHMICFQMSPHFRLEWLMPARPHQREQHAPRHHAGDLSGRNRLLRRDQRKRRCPSGRDQAEPTGAGGSGGCGAGGAAARAPVGLRSRASGFCAHAGVGDRRRVSKWAAVLE